MASMLRLWPYRWLLVGFMGRDIRGRYFGSVAGIFWVLIHPVVTLVVYSLVFTEIFRIRLPVFEAVGFTSFVALGLWPWLAFQEGVQRGTTSIVSNASLIKKVEFPHELLIYSSIGGAYLVHMVGYFCVMLLLSIFFTSINFVGLAVLVPLILVQMIFTVGLVFFLAALNALFHDIEQFLAPVLMILFYMTPILYPVEMTPDWLREIVSLNPMSYFVGRAREVMLGHNLMPQLPDMSWLLFSLLVFFVGRWFFLKLSPHFEDFL